MLAGRWAKAESPRHGTCCISGQRAAVTTRGHPHTARGPLQANPLPQKSAARAGRREKEDGRPSWGDCRGCMSVQRWLIAPAAGTEQLCQTGGSHGARLHTTLRITSVGLLTAAQGAGACGRSPFSGLACGWLRALLGGEHPSPCPLARLPRPRVLPAPSLRQAALAAAGPSACFHVCDVSDCVCRVLVYMGRRQRREGEGTTLREASEKKKKKSKLRRKKKKT